MNVASQGNIPENMASFEPINELDNMARVKKRLRESSDTINSTTTETLDNSSCFNWWVDFHHKIWHEFIRHTNTTAMELIFSRMQWHPYCPIFSPKWVSFVKHIKWGIWQKLIVTSGKTPTSTCIMTPVLSNQVYVNRNWQIMRH